MIRLNKKLVMIGYCSRRNADKLIEQHRVLVNGKTAVLGQIVNDTDIITIDGIEISSNNNDSLKKIILLYNKPKGVICTDSVVEKQTKISDLIEEFGFNTRLFTIGRLDKDTTGLIIVTNDGDLCKQITDTKNKYEKEYEVIVNKDIDDLFIRNMQNGVYIKELNKKTLPTKIKTYKNNKRKFNITIYQGLNRQIKRMCENLGYRVLELKRIRIINLKLADLKVGEFRIINRNEIKL